MQENKMSINFLNFHIPFPFVKDFLNVICQILRAIIFFISEWLVKLPGPQE